MIILTKIISSIGAILLTYYVFVPDNEVYVVYNIGTDTIDFEGSKSECKNWFSSFGKPGTHVICKKEELKDLKDD